MGLSGEQETGAGLTPTFSEDILSLEVCGPEQEHFSVIDVPGIFKNTTPGVTTKTDMTMVKTMVQKYMTNPRSVILAVVPSNVDIATQEILEMAKEADPKGERTLGVLTKPDLVDRGAERDVADLVEGKRHQLRLGWCLLRNPGQLDLSDQALNRHAIETDFFIQKAPWNGLDKDRVGIQALKARLREILAGHIRHEFPKVCLLCVSYSKPRCLANRYKGQIRTQQEIKKTARNLLQV